MRKEMDLSGGRDRAYACRHCLHVEDEGRRGKAAPGPYCQNPLGVFSMDDCPVLLGRECRQFVEREGPPEALGEEATNEVYRELLKDYMRWPYWERVRNLRRAPEEIPKKTVLEVEEKPEREDEEIVYRAPPPVPAAVAADGSTPAPAAAPEQPVVAAAATPAPAAAKPGEKPPEEKYPGQRRSEDRSRKKAAYAAGQRLPAAPRPAEPGAAPDEEADEPEEPVVKTVEQILAETPAAVVRHAPRPRDAGRGGEPATPATPATPGGGRRRRRRGRGRGRGEGERGPDEGRRPEGARPPSPPRAPSPPSGAPAPAPSGAPAGSAPGNTGLATPGPGSHREPGKSPGTRRRRRRRGPRPGGGPPSPGGPAGAAPPPPPPPPA
jgi:hypothetical protein